MVFMDKQFEGSAASWRWFESIGGILGRFLAAGDEATPERKSAQLRLVYDNARPRRPHLDHGPLNRFGGRFATVG